MKISPEQLEKAVEAFHGKWISRFTENECIAAAIASLPEPQEALDVSDELLRLMMLFTYHQNVEYKNGKFTHIPNCPGCEFEGQLQSILKKRLTPPQEPTLEEKIEAAIEQNCDRKTLAAEIAALMEKKK